MGIARSVASFAPLAMIASAAAQTQTASIAGRVVDVHSKVVPQAQLTVRNTDIGTTRTLRADGAGAFRVSGLSPGAYSVEATGGGLVLRPAVRLTLTLGSNTDLLLQMRIPPAKQGTTVTARQATVEGNTVAPPANTTEAAVGTFLPGLTITYLPNRDRDYTQFTTQAAGAELDVDGASLSIAGQRGSAIAVALDGTSFKDPLLGGIRGGPDGSLFLPLTAVREFELLRSGVDSTVAVTGAAVVNVATKFGVNRPRGEAFYTGRPANFTSEDAFGHGLDGEQNAFGASYSGPMRKGHAFYAISAEQDFVHAGRFVQFAPQSVPQQFRVATDCRKRFDVRHKAAAATFRLELHVRPNCRDDLVYTQWLWVQFSRACNVECRGQHDLRHGGPGSSGSRQGHGTAPA